MKKKWKAVVAVLAFAMVLNVPIPVLAGGTLNTDKLRTESVAETSTESVDEKDDVGAVEEKAEYAPIEQEKNEYTPEQENDFESVKEEEPENLDKEEPVKMPGSNRDDYQAVEKEEEAESGIDIFSILIVLLFAGIVGTSVMITKMFIDSNKARAKENEEYFVKKNEEFKASKARENEALDEYINSCEEDYSDDPDYEENSQDTPGTEEDGGENDESESGMDKTFEDIESDESEYAEVVAGEHALEKTQSQPAGHSFRMEQPSKNRNASANTPAWMRTMSDENEGDDGCFY